MAPDYIIGTIETYLDSDKEIPIGARVTMRDRNNPARSVRCIVLELSRQNKNGSFTYKLSAPEKLH